VLPAPSIARVFGASPRAGRSPRSIGTPSTWSCARGIRRGTGWGLSVVVATVQVQHSPARCFRCPKERRQGDPGWYFVDLQESRRLPGPPRLFVCPDDYLEFATFERVRWTLLLEPSNGSASPDDAGGVPAVDATAPACTAEDLIAALAGRGLAGWAFLVRDVAAGRVRRVHLRQLPADPEIRRSLVAYLHSAGAIVTVSRIFKNQERRLRQDA